MTMTVIGSGFSGKSLAEFGNSTTNVLINVTSDTMATLTIPRLKNTSVSDNSTAYGDNRITVEIGKQEVGYSRDEITFNYINHFKISTMTPELVSTTGDKIEFTGDGFINTPTLNCKFGPYLAQSVYYYNRTKIACVSPIIADET